MAVMDEAAEHGSPPTVALDWLPYHGALVEFLRDDDPHVWQWFDRSSTDPRGADEVRFDLLKSTYRFDRESQPHLYDTAGKVAKQLGLDVPVTIYQAQSAGGLNAALAYVPGELHVILQGPIAERLSDVELRALLAHELAHYLLYQCNGGQMWIASEMLRAMCNDARAHPAHHASMRLLTLYTELYCDRAALRVTGNLAAVVSTLVKVATGVQEIDPHSYLKQADEIFAKANASTDGITHPETFIRARAARLWSENDPDADALICRMIEGTPSIGELDVLAQRHVSAATRRLIDRLMRYKWFQSDLTLAHARLFFEDYAPPVAEQSDSKLAEGVTVEPKPMRDYYAFVLLDFVAADRELDEAGLAAALEVAEECGVKARFMELARQELRLRKNQIEKVDQQKSTILEKVQKSVGTP